MRRFGLPIPHPVLLGLFLLAAPLAANAAPSGGFRADILVPKVATLERPDQQYSLYLPPGYGTGRRWPVLLILDARGRAPMTAGLAMPAARRNGWIVLSSWQSRSDADEAGTLLALQSMLREVGRRYAHDPRRIYLAGFSGTAKTLWTQVEPLRPLVAGMLGNGGARPAALGPLHRGPVAFFGMAGEADFNYQEMRALDAALAEIGATHRFEAFPGPHGWPDARVFGVALDWFDLVAMRDGRAPRDEAWIDARLAEAVRAANAAPDALARARRFDQAARDFAGLREVSALRAEAASIADSGEARALAGREERLRRDERRAALELEEWIAQVSRRRVDGRETEPPAVTSALRTLRVGRLRKMAAGDDAWEAASAQRRLERILVAASFYLPERFLATGDEARALAMLRIATAVAPERGGPYWRMARLHAASGRIDDAFAALAEARRLGVVDQEDLRASPAWERMRDDPRWAAAVAAP